MARLINYCRHGNTTMRVLCIVELHVAFNSTETLILVMETQQWFPFVLLSSYKTVHTLNNIIFKSPYKPADIVGGNLKKYGIH